MDLDSEQLKTLAVVTTDFEASRDRQCTRGGGDTRSGRRRVYGRLSRENPGGVAVIVAEPDLDQAKVVLKELRGAPERASTGITSMSIGRRMPASESGEGEGNPGRTRCRPSPDGEFDVAVSSFELDAADRSAALLGIASLVRSVDRGSRDRRVPRRPRSLRRRSGVATSSGSIRRPRNRSSPCGSIRLVDSSWAGARLCSSMNRELMAVSDHERSCFAFRNSWVSDVEIRGNDLYVLTLSALYVVPDGVVKRHELARSGCCGACRGITYTNAFMRWLGGPKAISTFRWGTRSSITEILASRSLGSLDLFQPYGKARRPLHRPGSRPADSSRRQRPAGCRAEACGTVAVWSSITIGTCSATTTITSRCRWRTFPDD